MAGTGKVPSVPHPQRVPRSCIAGLSQAALRPCERVLEGGGCRLSSDCTSMLSGPALHHPFILRPSGDSGTVDARLSPSGNDVWTFVGGSIPLEGDRTRGVLGEQWGKCVQAHRQPPPRPAMVVRLTRPVYTGDRAAVNEVLRP